MWRLALILAIALVAGLDQLEDFVNSTLAKIDAFLNRVEDILLVEIPRLSQSLAVIMMASGAFLWLSGLWRGMGRNLVMTGAMLYLLAYAIRILA